MGKSKVLEVTDVELSILKKLPPALSIMAYATVPTPGWTEPELIEWIYVMPPPDGIYDFDLVAERPTGIVPQVITPIVGTHVLQDIPPGLKGVRIHASINSKEALLGGAGAKQQTVCVRGELTDEGIECQALRADSGELYTLVGDLKGFKIGDRVYVCGTIAEISFCQQGTTIGVTWISKDAPKL